MAVKYTIPYRSIDDTPWRVDILLDSWTDPAITVRGSADSACTIEYDGGVDDPFDNAVVTSKAAIQLINQGEVDMDELQYAGDRDFVVEVYRDNVLKWKGYLITDNIQQPLLSAPNVVQLSAIDGLNMLENIPYTHNNLQTEGQGIAVRSPLNYLRQCLFASSNLGLMLPIRWHVGLENVVTEDDAIAGMMTWSPYGDGFIVGQSSGGTIYQNCRYIVEGLVKAFGCRLFQADGAWHVMRTNDIIGGSFTYNECDATLDAPTITQHSVDIARTVSGRGQGADYEFIREDGLLTVKPALGLVDIEYDSDRRENILPNGGLDVWSLGVPLYWGFTDNPDDAPFYEQFESLTGQPGQAVQMTNDGVATADAEFTYGGGLPVDANLLFKRMTFGFTIMPTQYGFPYDENEIIDWSNNPLKVSVMYTLPIDGGVREYYLNEFGYWQFEGRGLGLGVLFVNMDVQFNPPLPPVPASYNHHAIYEGTPNVGDVLVITIRGVDYSFTVGAPEEGNLELALDGLLAALPSSIAGWTIDNKAVIMDSATRGSVRFRYAINVDAATGRTYKSGATQEYQYIFPKPEMDKPVEINSIISYVFRGSAGNNEILIPDPGLLDGQQDSAVGKLYVRFYLKPGQRYVLDEIWVRTEDNNDVYRVNSPVTGNSTSQRITMGISSSFSGFMVSNMMRGYSTSNEDFLWSDGSVTASLTEHYARAVMRWRYKPSRIFNGTLNTRTKDWSFFEVYSLLGSNFLPLNAKYNTEKCEVWTVAMEGRDDGVITDVKHYASNNMPLSNYGGN